MYKQSLRFSILLFASVFLISAFYAVFEPLQVQSQQPVNSSNRVETAPIADAGHDQTATSGSIVTLNGSGSFDPDGDNITDYMWMQWAGPSIALPEASPQSPSFGAPSVESPQNITFRLTVSDSKTESAPDYTTVQIFPRGQAPPTTTASVPTPSPSPSPSTNASETVMATNATTGVPQGEGIDTATTNTIPTINGSTGEDTIKRSISSLLSSSNISESSIVNSILDKIISTNGTGASSLASLIGSLFSSPSDGNGANIQDMVEAAADVEASNATANATDADAVAAAEDAAAEAAEAEAAAASNATANATDADATDANNANKSTISFVASGTISSILNTPTATWIPTGDWNLVSNGDSSSFESNMTWYNTNGTSLHTHNIENFVPIEQDPESQQDNGTITIEGTADVGTNGVVSWSAVPIKIDIAGSKTISIAVDDELTDNHFAGQPVHGLVNAITPCSDTPGPDMEVLPPCFAP